MKRIHRLVVIICTLCITTYAWSWSYTGHVLIAQMAYQQLTPSAKVEADRLAKQFYASLAPSEQEKLQYYYPYITPFAQLASLPDNWRSYSVYSLFQRYNATIPANLKAYADSTTETWHFINQAYPAYYHCDTIKTPNIVSILPLLITDLSNSDDQTKALLMVFVEHLVGDIHQPLHTITLVNKYCMQDYGGTATCLKRNAKGRCLKNLHQLWDSGVGLLAPKTNIMARAYSLTQQLPKTHSLSHSNDIQQWANENYAHANAIYSMMNIGVNLPNYYRDSHVIVEKRLLLASIRLANILNVALSHTQEKQEK